MRLACVAMSLACMVTPARVRRYVSKAGAGSSKSAGDRLFLYLNGRPIDLPKVGAAPAARRGGLAHRAAPAAPRRRPAGW